MKYQLSIIKYPSGRYGFVGSVPSVLAFVEQHAEDLANAAAYGPGIARKIAAKSGRTLTARTFATQTEAEAARTAADF